MANDVSDYSFGGYLIDANSTASGEGLILLQYEVCDFDDVKRHRNLYLASRLAIHNALIQLMKVHNLEYIEMMGHIKVALNPIEARRVMEEKSDV